MILAIRGKWLNIITKHQSLMLCQVLLLMQCLTYYHVFLALATFPWSWCDALVFVPLILAAPLPRWKAIDEGSVVNVHLEMHVGVEKYRNRNVMSSKRIDDELSLLALALTTTLAGQEENWLGSMLSSCSGKTLALQWCDPMPRFPMMNLEMTSSCLAEDRGKAMRGNYEVVEKGLVVLRWGRDPLMLRRGKDPTVLERRQGSFHVEWRQGSIRVDWRQGKGKPDKVPITKYRLLGGLAGHLYWSYDLGFNEDKEWRIFSFPL
ncbi:hypothetical protein L1987_37470 [Smallanthus sonchifolius]|uniref:Uncharacterized protein n=1 Tax=Smallanthus sonchifolius TaxID=185202 RepID=A0ACB9HHT8_9ASTR|nr:hypothetical protein L1987_37470 [Smallanthus sonchifolius]